LVIGFVLKISLDHRRPVTETHLRRIGACTFTDMFNAIAEICDLYSPDQYWNYFTAAGYGASYRRDALAMLSAKPSRKTPVKFEVSSSEPQMAILCDKSGGLACKGERGPVSF